MPANLAPVLKHELKLNEPMPYSVYDRQGNLLLKVGHTIQQQRLLDILLEKGACIQVADREAYAGGTAAPKPYNVFSTVDALKLRLQRLFAQYRGGRTISGFCEHIAEIGLAVQKACEHNTDAALASLHLDYDMPYEVVHHLEAAVLCELISQKLEIQPAARLTLINAALTHDISLIDIQDALNRQRGPMKPDQAARVQSHPTDSVAALRALGVADPHWLVPVGQHHERIDGSGYPARTVGAEISLPSRILAVADIYSALIRERPYRKAVVSSNAMREMLVEQGSKTDLQLTQLMIKALGVFPPGALVQLATGEVAVVLERRANSAQPIVAAFLKPDGLTLLAPARRDTAKPEFAIKGIESLAKHKQYTGMIQSLWSDAPRFH